MKKKLISLVLVVAMIICSNNYEIIESSDSVKKCYSEVAEVCLESADGSKLRENRYVDTIQKKNR